MPAITASTKEGHDYVRVSPSGADWEEFTFPDWVVKAYIRTFAGDGYVSETAEGVFSASATSYNTLRSAANDVHVFDMIPTLPSGKRRTSIRMAHSLGASGVFEIELQG